MNFITKLRHAWSSSNSLLCVGLDPDPSKFPISLHGRSDAIWQFNKAIIDATHDLVCAYKPQIAYFASQSAEDQLLGTLEYLGSDSITPFTRYADKGVIILCRTSNTGAQDFQDLTIEGKPLYLHVAHKVANEWNTHGNCVLVVGATWPEQMQRVREVVGDMPLLVPGIGAQGGDVKALVTVGKTKAGDGLIISSSRAVLYASTGEDFAQAARNVAQASRDEINLYR